MTCLPARIYDALDRLGYSKALSKKRIQIYDNAAKCLSLVHNRNWHEYIHIIVAGSRGEGMAVSWNSDIDVIYVQPMVKCFKTFQGKDFTDVQDYVATFQLKSDNVPEGYAKLRLNSHLANIKEGEAFYSLTGRIRESLTDRNYLKNDRRLIQAIEYGGEGLEKNGWISQNYRFDDITGPAQPLRFPFPVVDKYISVDLVAAFPCSYPSIFDVWCQRKRTNIWPNAAVVDAVKETDLFVVPVGKTGSQDTNLQWRISFTPAEICLVHSFNDTQIKVYAAMKILTKQKLKPLCNNINSYIIKNVIFWVFELRTGTFEKEDFFELLLQSLEFLKHCVNKGCLQNYIIPCRNLLLGKISEEEAKNLVNCLECLIKDRSGGLLSCPIIHNMFNLSENELEKGLLFRQVLEQCSLAFLAIKPSVFDIIQLLFHQAKAPCDFIEISFSHVSHIIRDNNPFDYFGLIRSMKNKDILEKIVEGFKLGYDDVWME